MSSLDLAARISVALCVWGIAPIATAETVKEGPGADWDRPRTLEEKMRTSFEEAVLVVRGTVRPAAGADLHPLDYRGFASMRVRFEVDEIYKGETAQETLRLDLPTYEIPESAPSREGDGSPMGETWSRLRALERELEAGGLDWHDYERRRSALREELLTSPEYREGGHLLARIGIRGAIPPSHRNADQLLRMGGSYVLMMDTEPWDEGFTPLRSDLVDIYPSAQMHVLKPILRSGTGALEKGELAVWPRNDVRR